MRRISVAARAGVNADLLALLRREPRERQVVQVDETREQLAGRIHLHGQAAFGEVDLHLHGALLEAAAHFGHVLAQQIIDELLAWIARQCLGWVHEAQSRRRNHRLLQRLAGVAPCDVQIGVGIALVPERPARQARHPPRVTGGERNLEAVGRRVLQPVDTVGPEIVVLPLFAVGDDRGPRLLEPLDRVLDRRLIERLQARIVAVSRFESLEQRGRSRYAANRLGRNVHRCAVRVALKQSERQFLRQW